MKQKRGQFFILAAVILVSLLAGIFLYTNQVFLMDYRQGLKLIGEEVETESGAVINQYVANNENNIEDFIVRMSESLIDRKQSVEMIFIYNLGGNISVFNLAREEINLTVNETIETIPSSREIILVSVSAGSMGLGDSQIVNIIKDNVTHIPITKFDSDPKNITFFWNEIPHTSPWPEDKNLNFVLQEKIGDDNHGA